MTYIVLGAVWLIVGLVVGVIFGRAAQIGEDAV